MCTVSVLQARDGYALWFNRDELDTRAPEGRPASFQSEAGLRFAHPIDGQRGGTWLMVNGAGLCAALLNDYHASAPAGVVSRGIVPLWCAEARSVDSAADHVLSKNATGSLAALGPFRLLLVDAVGNTALMHWNGETLLRLPGQVFLTSSSREPARIEARRTELHMKLPTRTFDTLEAFHWSHQPMFGAESVLMRRSDAHTRSVTRVEARRGGSVVLTYTPVAWGSAVPEPIRLEVAP